MSWAQTNHAKLEAHKISKIFASRHGAVEALRDVSLTVMDGSLYTIIGHSGCGKSTLLNIIAGLEEADSGEVTIDGLQRIDPGPDRGMVFQSYTLFPWLTVAENVGFGLKIQKILAAERREMIMHYLSLVQLSDFAKAYPKELSGGMKQRVALARALATKPAVLLMDEPFGALDAETREKMQDFLLTIREQEHMTVLFITHDVDEAIILSECIGIMSVRPGQLREEIVIDLPFPRHAEMKMTAEFLDVKRHVVERFKAA